jgi:hypothetical protein
MTNAELRDLWTALQAARKDLALSEWPPAHLDALLRSAMGEITGLLIQGREGE